MDIDRDKHGIKALRLPLVDDAISWVGYFSLALNLNACLRDILLKNSSK